MSLVVFLPRCAGAVSVILDAKVASISYADSGLQGGGFMLLQVFRGSVGSQVLDPLTLSTPQNPGQHTGDWVLLDPAGESEFTERLSCPSV